MGGVEGMLRRGEVGGVTSRVESGGIGIRCMVDGGYDLECRGIVVG